MPLPKTQTNNPPREPSKPTASKLRIKFNPETGKHEVASAKPEIFPSIAAGRAAMAVEEADRLIEALAKKRIEK